MARLQWGVRPTYRDVARLELIKLGIALLVALFGLTSTDAIQILNMLACRRRASARTN